MLEFIIRRDLVEFEVLGIIKRIYGGVVNNFIIFFEFFFVEKEDKFVKEKEYIGKFVVSFIKDGDIIIFDFGIII